MWAEGILQLEAEWEQSGPKNPGLGFYVSDFPMKQPFQKEKKKKKQTFLFLVQVYLQHLVPVIELAFWLSLTEPRRER